MPGQTSDIRKAARSCTCVKRVEIMSRFGKGGSVLSRDIAAVSNTRTFTDGARLSHAGILNREASLAHQLYATPETIASALREEYQISKPSSREMTWLAGGASHEAPVRESTNVSYVNLRLSRQILRAGVLLEPDARFYTIALRQRILQLLCWHRSPIY